MSNAWYSLQLALQDRPFINHSFTNDHNMKLLELWNKISAGALLLHTAAQLQASHVSRNVF